MIDVVYLYRHAPAKWEELRYSLRSLEKYLKVPHRVVIVSDDLPAWVRNVAFLPCPHDGVSRYADVTRKIELVASCPLISDQVLFMYDDIYLLKDPGADLSVFSLSAYQVELVKTANPFIKTWYGMLQRTLEWLRAAGYPQYNMETHMPRMVTKSDLQQMLKVLPVVARNMQRWTAFGNWEIKHKMLAAPVYVSEVKAGFYGYFGPNSIASETMDQIKSATRGKLVLNHNDQGLTSSLRQFIQSQFPNPSRYETR